MKTILIAEDDIFLANAYRVKFEKKEFNVLLAGDGIEVLDILSKKTPNIILLDLVMPNMDGFTTLVEIKKNKKFEKIPIIVASNLGQKEDVERATQNGADDFIIKSDTTMEEIYNKVASLLKL